jgi:hypothetical protein
MAKDSTETLLILGGVAVGGYFLYNWLTTPVAVAAPTATGTPTTGTTTNPPASTPVGPESPTLNAIGEPMSYEVPGGGRATTPTTLAGLWVDIQGWAATDSNFQSVGGVLQGTPDHWSYYISMIWPNTPTGYTGSWPPDTNSILAAALPGLDFTQPMTSSRFWSTILPALQSGGLSGLGCGCDGGPGAAAWLVIGALAGAILLGVVEAQR